MKQKKENNRYYKEIRWTYFAPDAANISAHSLGSENRGQ
jgi:hypothetical protein